MQTLSRCILLVLLQMLGLSSMALANGYDVYASPLCWSPDGRLLAAAVNATWPRDDTLAEGRLRLYGRNGEVVAELVEGLVGTPSFSPDGKLLAAVVDGNLRIFDVRAAAPWEGFTPQAGSPSQGGAVLDCRWCLDGQHGASIWYTAGARFYGCKCHVLDPLTGEESEIWGDAAGGSMLAAQPSPDGRFLLALAQNSTLCPQAAYERLVVWPVAGQARQAARNLVRADDYHESNAVYSGPSSLIFQRGGWGDWRLYSLDLASGLELPELSDAQHPALDARGEWLAYVRRDYGDKAEADYDWELPSTVRLRNRKAKGDWLASTPGIYAELPALSQDGTRIAWLEQGPDSAAHVAIRTVAGITAHGPGARLGQGSSASSAPRDLIGMLDATSAADQPASQGQVRERMTSATLGAFDGVNSASEANTATEAEAREAQVERVTLSTSKGDIVLAVHHDWDPAGAERFLELVDSGFYDGAPWFRVIDGFVAQCGIAADPELNALWRDRTIEDRPVVVPNARGTLAFGKTAAPHSRSTHIFINYRDNSGPLDPQGFSPFAEVVSGMEVADSLTRCEYSDQLGLAGPGGLELFAARFPDADYILAAWRGGPAEEDFECPADSVTEDPLRVVLETTKGSIVLEVHHDWAPIGAAHFLELVRLGFYDGAPWFRVIDRVDPQDPGGKPLPFVAQCGIAADPALNAQWGEANIQDDPVVQGNTRGRVAYGKTDEPHSRSTHIYINFGDNSRLDARGFAAFAEVVAGMEVADALFRCEYEDQDKLAEEGGLADFRSVFPEADYILHAYVAE